MTIASSATVLYATALFLIDVPLRIGGLVSGQTRLVTELYSQGQASLGLAQLNLVQPVNFSTALSKSLEVAPPARKSTCNSFDEQYESALWCNNSPSAAVLHFSLFYHRFITPMLIHTPDDINIYTLRLVSTT